MISGGHGRLEALGRSLREIRADYLREENGEAVRWFQGRHGTDLFAWSSPDGEVSRIQLTFARSVVEWQRDGGLRTGRLDPSFGGGPGRFDTYLIRSDDAAQLEVLRAARVLLEASAVDQQLAGTLFEAIEGVLGPAERGENAK